MFKHLNILSNNNNLASYLAGLLEADGVIWVTADPIKKNEMMISFAFNKDDLSYAEFLKEKFNMGKIVFRKNEHCCNWTIYKEHDIYQLLSFINGHFRTGKIEALNRGLQFFKDKHNIDIPLKPLDNSPILENAWFSGFSDGDSSFFINIQKKSFYFYYALEVAENYSREVNIEIGERNNKNFMEKIANIFTTTLYFRSRLATEKSKATSSYTIRINRKDNISLLIEYFNKFPLFSSPGVPHRKWGEYLNYCDWVKAFNLRNETKEKGLPLSTIFNQIENIKNGMNSKRDSNIITWNHLESFYSISSLFYLPNILKKRK